MIQQQALFSFAWPNSSKLFSRFSTNSSCQIHSPHQICLQQQLKKCWAPYSRPSPYTSFYKATSLHPIIPSALKLQEAGHGILALAIAHSFTCNMTAPKPIWCLQSTDSLPALVLHFQQGMLVTPQCVQINLFSYIVLHVLCHLTFTSDNKSTFSLTLYI